jgi:hypothetical protein
MFFEIVGMIFDVTAQMFLFVFSIPLGSTVTYGGVVIVSTIVFGIAHLVLSQLLDRPAEYRKEQAQERIFMKRAQMGEIKSDIDRARNNERKWSQPGAHSKIRTRYYENKD